MILYELTYQNEADPLYVNLQTSNLDRQFRFLNSMVETALRANRALLSQTLIKALNFHAIVCLHPDAGVYRTYPVGVGDPNRGGFLPPVHARVSSLMDDFINVVNREWEQRSAIELAATVLWNINHIHPFINGNGRTARAASYFVICLKYNMWLPGDPILPVRLQQHRSEIITALKKGDASYGRYLDDLMAILDRLLEEQIGKDRP